MGRVTAFLGTAIGDATLVGLGEATHGTREFWTMRRKISRYLAAAHEALGYWRYQEMQDLIAWIRDYNLQRGSDDPVLHYFGYDCAAANWSGHTAVITDFLDRVDPESTAEVEGRLEEFALVLRVAQLLEPTWRVVDALRNGTPDGNIRESCAAENVEWIVENLLDGGKAVIWAHNAHIGNPTLGDISGAPTQWLGTRLKNRLGSGYYMLGAEFYGGSFLAWEFCGSSPTEFTLHQAAAPPQDSYAYTFHQAGVPLFFLDLDGVNFAEEGAAWLNGPRKIRF